MNIYIVIPSLILLLGTAVTAAVWKRERTTRPVLYPLTGMLVFCLFGGILMFCGMTVRWEVEDVIPDHIAMFDTGITVVVVGQEIYTSVDAEVYLCDGSNLVVETVYGYDVFGRCKTVDSSLYLVHTETFEFEFEESLE